MLSVTRYRDRSEAGRKLARLLHLHGADQSVLVLALPRGGVAVALEIARALAAPLDVFIVRKLGMPGDEEFALGAIATGGVRLLDDELIAEEQIPVKTIATITAREMAELHRREAFYRRDRPPLSYSRRHVILVDDGIATGYTMRSAIAALAKLGPASVTAAAPVGSVEACETIARTVCELVCPFRPDPFHAVGLWYEHFPQVPDEEVAAALAEADSWSTA